MAVLTTAMLRYMAFGGCRFVPVGGIGDLVGIFYTIEDAIMGLAHAMPELIMDQDGLFLVNVKTGGSRYWAHVYDLKEQRIVVEGYYADNC